MLKYSLEIKATAQKELDALDDTLFSRIDRKILALAENPRPAGCNVPPRLRARASRTKSGSVTLVRRSSSRTVMKKYRSERNVRRSFDPAVEYPTVEPTATEKTRTTKAAVRATRYLLNTHGTPTVPWLPASQ